MGHGGRRKGAGRKRKLPPDLSEGRRVTPNLFQAGTARDSVGPPQGDHDPSSSTSTVIRSSEIGGPVPNPPDDTPLETVVPTPRLLPAGQVSRQELIALHEEAREILGALPQEMLPDEGDETSERPESEALDEEGQEVNEDQQQQGDEANQEDQDAASASLLYLEPFVTKLKTKLAEKGTITMYQEGHFWHHPKDPAFSLPNTEETVVSGSAAATEYRPAAHCERSIFVWLPHVLTGKDISCPEPGCAGHLVHSGFRTDSGVARTRSIQTVQGKIWLIANRLRCRNGCGKSFSSCDERVLNVLPERIRLAFPFYLAKNSGCDATFMGVTRNAMISGMSPAHIAALFNQLHQLEHSRAELQHWMLNRSPGERRMYTALSTATSNMATVTEARESCLPSISRTRAQLALQKRERELDAQKAAIKEAELKLAEREEQLAAREAQLAAASARIPQLPTHTPAQGSSSSARNASDVLPGPSTRRAPNSVFREKNCIGCSTSDCPLVRTCKGSVARNKCKCPHGFDKAPRLRVAKKKL